MMANWDILNKQFDNLLTSMSSEEWHLWANNRANKKAMRTSEMLLKAKLQEEKIVLSSLKGKEIISQTDLFSDHSFVCISSITGVDYPKSPSYAMAA